MIRPLPPLFIIGSPIGHSLSPLLHNAALHELGIPLSYEAIEVRANELQDFVHDARTSNIIGFNVTIPHKEAIIPLLDKLDESARRIGAVNTVVKTGQGLVGYNTDVVGVEKTLELFRAKIARASSLLLGAGGAARAAAYALEHSFYVQKLFVAARSVEKAKRLISDLEINNAERIPWEEFFRLTSHDAVLIVNTTPIGMHPRTDESPLGSVFHFTVNQIAFDAIYRPLKTKFLGQAENDGAIALSGLPMLLHQAAAAFNLWTGKEMPIDKVRSVLQEKLKNERS
jgi:shikimate dehydrogenase